MGSTLGLGTLSHSSTCATFIGCAYLLLNPHLPRVLGDSTYNQCLDCGMRVWTPVAVRVRVGDVIGLFSVGCNLFI